MISLKQHLMFKLFKLLISAVIIYSEHDKLIARNWCSFIPWHCGVLSQSWAACQQPRHLRLVPRWIMSIADERWKEPRNTYGEYFRLKFLQNYIEVTLEPSRSNVQGYFVWSFLDVFEYLFGY
ncbi:hypothetical protein ACQ4PT_017087 [Festuca glaucescens]